MNNSFADRANEAMDVVKEQIEHAVASGQKTTTSLTSDLRNVIKGQITRQKDIFADEIASTANAIRALNDTLHHSGAITSGAVFDNLAGRIEAISDSLHDRDIDEIIAETVSFARANPAVFIWSAVGVGFITARFLKSRKSAV